MPNYKGHLAGGIFAYLLSLYMIISYKSITLATGLEWLLFCLLGSLFPDVDTKSKGQKIFYWVVLLLAAVLLFSERLQGLLLLGALGIFPLLVRHRGIFHQLWFIILIPIAIAWLACGCWPNCSTIIAFDALFFIIGALSHLWLDLGLLRLLGLR